MSEEEKIALKIGNMISNLNLDIETVGKYLANTVSNVGYNRLIVIAESAESEKERMYVRATSDTLW